MIPSNISTIHYFLWSPEDREWECRYVCLDLGLPASCQPKFRETYQISPRGLCCPSSCNEVPIVNYTRAAWKTLKDVLTYLLNSPNMRHHLKHVSDLARPADSDFILLVHPLFETPICLESGHNDVKFKAIINERLKKECGEADKQVVLYSKPNL